MKGAFCALRCVMHACALLLELDESEFSRKKRIESIRKEESFVRAENVYRRYTINTGEENHSRVFHGSRIVRVTLGRYAWRKGLSTGIAGHCTESMKSVHGTALYRQCNLPDATYLLFSSVPLFAFSAASIYSSRRRLTPSTASFALSYL